MRSGGGSRTFAVVAACLGLSCGSEAQPAPGMARLLVDERDGERLAARYVSRDGALELAASSSAPLAGDVLIAAGPVSFEVHYDFGRREVIADGRDGALDRHTHTLLRDAAQNVARFLGPAPGEAGAPPLHEQMLSAGLVLLADSGGMPLSRVVYRLDAGQPPPGADTPGGGIDKSLGDDGVRCVERGSTESVSFDDRSGTTLEREVKVDTEDCNGKCGPACAPLTPWAMWTLDCLEHDTCCSAADEGPACWTPLGQCGDEYVHAELDFLRGFDPLGRHCKG